LWRENKLDEKTELCHYSMNRQPNIFKDTNKDYITLTWHFQA